LLLERGCCPARQLVIFLLLYALPTFTPEEIAASLAHAFGMEKDNDKEAIQLGSRSIA